MAIARANFENIPINLVTAVPSIETYENIRKGKYSISKLSERFKKGFAKGMLGLQDNGIQ